MEAMQGVSLLDAANGDVGRSHPPRVLAVASTGGHWVQLFRMRLAWSGCDVHYATTVEGFRDPVAADARRRGEPATSYHVLPDANRWQKARLGYLLLAVAALVVRVRPDVVISTGAAPGYFALRIARLLGAKTIWIDSIANAEQLSLSGQRIGPSADVWLTQWQELAKPGGPDFWGSVL